MASVWALSTYFQDPSQFSQLRIYDWQVSGIEWIRFDRWVEWVWCKLWMKVWEKREEVKVWKCLFWLYIRSLLTIHIVCTPLWCFLCVSVMNSKMSGLLWSCWEMQASKWVKFLLRYLLFFVRTVCPPYLAGGAFPGWFYFNRFGCWQVTSWRQRQALQSALDWCRAHCQCLHLDRYNTLSVCALVSLPSFPFHKYCKPFLSLVSISISYPSASFIFPTSVEKSCM